MDIMRIHCWLKMCYHIISAITLLQLSGCTTLDQSAQKYIPKNIEASKGIVVGSVFERSVFTPYGAYFYIQSTDGNKITLSSGARTGSYAIISTPPLPKGVGNPFALQLPPGKYQVVGWALDYGSTNKHSLPPEPPIEFEVVAGKISYLGRFDASRLLEVASIHDNFEEDITYIKKSFPLGSIPITNKSISIKGWWLINPAGKVLMKEMGKKISPREQ